MSHKKYVCVLLVLLIAIQPALNKSIKSAPEETDKYFLVEKELLEFTFKNLNSIHLNYGNKVRKIGENILKDFPLNEKIIDKKTLLEEYAINSNNTYANFEQILNVLESIIDNDEYLKRLTEIPKFQTKAQIISYDFDVKVLTEIRSQKLDSQCKTSLQDFLKKLQQKIEDLKIFWSNDEALQKWFKGFKTVKNFDYKMEAVEEFIFGLCGNLKLECYDES